MTHTALLLFREREDIPTREALASAGFRVTGGRIDETAATLKRLGRCAPAVLLIDAEVSHSALETIIGESRNPGVQVLLVGHPCRVGRE